MSTVLAAQRCHIPRRMNQGDRTVVSSAIGCGHGWYCKQQQWSLCDNSNPNGWLQEKVYGHGTGAIFGYSHAFGGYAGSFADYIRIPFAMFKHKKDQCIKVMLQPG